MNPLETPQGKRLAWLVVTLRKKYEAHKNDKYGPLYAHRLSINSWKLRKFMAGKRIWD